MLTVDDAATVDGFMIEKDLDFYPKIFLFKSDLVNHIKDLLYPNAKLNTCNNCYCENDVVTRIKSLDPNLTLTACNECYYEIDNLADITPPAAANLGESAPVTFTDISRGIYAQRFFKPGESLMMIFKNDMNNLLRLTMSYNSILTQITFKKIVTMIQDFQKMDSVHGRLPAKI